MCHAKETKGEDRKSPRSAHAKGQDRATKIGRTRSARAKRHGRAAAALLWFGFKRMNFVLFSGELVSLASFSFVAVFFFFLLLL